MLKTSDKNLGSWKMDFSEIKYGNMLVKILEPLLYPVACNAGAVKKNQEQGLKNRKYVPVGNILEIKGNFR